MKKLIEIMIKGFSSKFVATCLCVLLWSSFCVAKPRVHDLRKRTVDNFLKVWLVHKDIPAALKFFHSRALSNASVIDNSCPIEDYIPDSERNNPNAVRSGVSHFLKDGSQHIKGNRLDNILFLASKEHPKQSAYLSELLKKVSFNRTERDRYYLSSFSSIKSLSKDDDWADLEKRYGLRDSFVSVIQYRVLNEDVRYGDDIVVMFLWAKEGTAWKIVFAAVPSCLA